ncbi:MAG: hypothetical protein PHW03_09410 [Eubacteriales bacterium]|nr:hypothetical protein [Eubacteriales bacterium]
MSFTLAGYYKSLQTSGALAELDAVVDQSLTTKGTDIIVPDFADKIFGLHVKGATVALGQITSPSLRKKSLLDVGKLDVGMVTTDNFMFNSHWKNPITLTPGEALRAYVANTAGAPETDYVFVALGDEVKPVEGDVQTIRCNTTLSAGAPAGIWNQCADLSISQQLDAGDYNLVGLRVMGTGAFAGRVIIPGSAYRPGCLAVQSVNQIDAEGARRGESGVWGTFNSIYPPQIEVIGTGLGTAFTVYLDLVKVSA